MRSTVWARALKRPRRTSVRLRLSRFALLSLRPLNVTQAIVSPYLGGKTLGLAKVRKEHAKPGTKVTARVGDETVAGEIVPHPVYDPKRLRAKETG